MKIYIFDLDNTLLYKPYKTYGDIKADLHLYKLLDEIPHAKYIYSNATRNHVDRSLDRIGIDSMFQAKFTRDDVTMKPDPRGYQYVNTMTLFQSVNLDYDSFQPQDTYFFDDLLENLYTAKQFGWITFWISSSDQTYDFVDFQFSTIVEALRFLKTQEIQRGYSPLSLI